MALGWAVLGLLTALAGINALAAAVRSEPSCRAELGIVASAVFFAQLAAPGLVLGYLGVLTKTTVGVFALLTFAAISALLARGRPWRALLRDCGRAAASLARLPYDALREALRGRSLVALGLLYAAGILVACLFFTVFAPNTGWDGFLYHEPIVGFALQNHSFAVVDLPMTHGTQATNGYPRAGEMIALWFVVFTDKTLIELPNDLAAPAMMLVTYLLCRRYGDRMTAMGWACVLLLMPQAWAQLCQTYIDLEVAFFALVAVTFATRPVLRVRDAWLAALGMLLLVGSKGTGLAIVPPIALVVAVRLLRSHWRSRRAACIASIGVGGLLVAVLGALPPLRNLRAFDNPIWPTTLDVPRLGIHWSGLLSMSEMVSDKPISELLDIAHGIPVGGMDDVIARGYGYAIVWVLLPVGVAGVVVGLGAAILEWLRLREASVASNLGLVLLLLLAGAAATPTFAGQSARYNLNLVALVMAAATWLFAGRAWARAREGVIAACIVLSIIPLFWMKGPGWYWVNTAHPADVLWHPLESRTALARPSFDLLARQRNEELGPGDLAVFDQDVGFLGALWNFEMSNRVAYLQYHSRSEWLKAIQEMEPKWVAVGASGDSRKALEATKRWEYIGEIAPGNGAVFRRAPHS